MEGVSHKSEFKHTPFKEDELVLVTAAQNAKQEEITPSRLQSLPFVMREDGSGTLAVIQKFLHENGIALSKLNIIARLGSTEAIKRFLLAGNCYAIISISAIANELLRGELALVEITDKTIKRNFAFITNKGSYDKLATHFMNFALSSHNKML